MLLPSGVETSSGRRLASRTTLRVVYVVLFAALAVGYYEFLGAGATPSERAASIPWWKPAGWARSLESPLLEPLQQIGSDTVQARHEGRFEPRSLIPLGLFAVPVAVATALGFLLFRSALARAALLAGGATLCAFCYYGWLDVETWRDYGWRWPLVLLSTAGYLAVFALAPGIVEALRRRSTGVLVAAAAAFVLPIHLLSIEVTGTNPSLEWNLSPWPTLTLYGFLLCGLVIGVIHLAAGVGLWVRGFAPGRGRLAFAALAAAVVAIALHGVPFEHAGAGRLAVLALPAALLAAVARRRHPQGAAVSFLAAGLLVLASIKLGQIHAEWFLTRARDQTAPAVIAALERYHERRDAYPEELDELVPEELPAIAQPRIGWLDADEEVFTYTNLGDSFLLEFSGPVWVQCAYSPPYEEELEEEEAQAEGEGGEAPLRLEAAWSCERRPPRLW
jgi:hypothetical protein